MEFLEKFSLDGMCIPVVCASALLCYADWVVERFQNGVVACRG